MMRRVLKTSTILGVLLLSPTMAESVIIIPGGTTADTAPSLPGFYVSTAGNDSNAGTLAAPFLTLGKCQTAMQGGATKTCYARAGTYSLFSGLTLDSNDAGETWSNYPPDGNGSPNIILTNVFPLFTLNTGADNVTINGLYVVGAQHTAHTSCTGTKAVFAMVGPSSGNNAGPVNFLATNNIIKNMDCGIGIAEATSPNVSSNQFSIIEYDALYCNHCNAVSGSSTFDNNIFYDLNPDGTGSQNAYGISFSPSANGVSQNITVTGNKCFNNPTWQCYNSHGGTNITFQNNLAVGAKGPAFNVVSVAPSSPTNTVITNNIIDNGVFGTTIVNDSIVQCGSSGCGSNTGQVGGSITNNRVRFGSANGTVIAFSPAVTVSGNVGNLNPEQVSSVDFGGSSNATFPAGSSNTVVANISVNMSATDWTFPPVGTLTIGGTNSGGFQICNNTKICQSGAAGGTPVGTYNDFSVVVTLHGMLGSPYTQTVGSLTLVGQ